MSSIQMASLIQKVALTIQSHQLAGKKDRILVAFSGGADSTAMAVVLERLGLDLVLGHVDHGMRRDSQFDVGHCSRTAKRLSVDLLTKRVKVEPPTEAEARARRYEALEKMMKECGASRIATGHTKDDQAETVVMRIRRGGFPLGIPYRRGSIIRPILDLRRNETELVCQLEGIDYLLDPTNYDLSFQRNLIRHSVLAGAGAGTIERLVGAADESRSSINALNDEFLRACSFGDVVIAPGQVEVLREFLTESSSEMRRHTIARALDSISIQPSSRLMRDVEKKVLPTTGARLDLPSSRSVRSTKKWLVFGTDPQTVDLPTFDVVVPGSAVSAEWGFGMTVEEAAPQPLDATWEQVVSGDAIEDGRHLLVRRWKPGDRFHPLGAPGSKKLQDFFVDSGVPRDVRGAVPIVEYAGSIVWVVGMRIDDRFKITSSTQRALRLSVFTTVAGVKGPAVT